MNQIILDKIKKNLYRIEAILATDSIVELLSQYSIDSKKFLDTIHLYLKRFKELQDIEDEILLGLLDEELSYFAKNSQDATRVGLYHTQLSASVTFIEDKVDTFLKHADGRFTSVESQQNKKTINKPISTIEIQDLFSIKNLKLSNLEEKKEIYIVGENGDGKTLLLQAIAIGLKDCQEDGQGVFRKIRDSFSINILFKNNHTFNTSKDEYKNIIAYGSNRNNSCKMDIDKSGYLTLFDNSLDLYDPINWLIEIYNAEQSDEIPVVTLEKAKEILKKLLNREISIDVAYNSVSFKEKGSSVEFNQLSAGYKSVIILICDMIQRLSKNQQTIKKISDLKGIVLIDEVELHLHPKWKYDFVTKLREIFPLIQFIVTTHSPTVILGASKEAVFYKIYKEDGEVNISNQIENEGYTNNTLISSPLFDLETMKSKHYPNRELSEDDYIYSKIHKVVSQRVKENINLSEDDIFKLIDEQLNQELTKL